MFENDRNFLVRRQDRLRAEADKLGAELDLTGRLGAIGEPVLVGSAALGVMVRRDLDFTVTCQALDHATQVAVARLGAELAVAEPVREVRLRDDTGHWNVDPMYPDGLYLGVACRASDGQDWTLDLWFVDEPDRQPDLEHLRTLAPRLDDRSRALILGIKTELAARPDPPTGRIPSYQVYRAVLDHGIGDIAEFDAWHHQQQI